MFCKRSEKCYTHNVFIYWKYSVILRSSCNRYSRISKVVFSVIFVNQPVSLCLCRSSLYRVSAHAPLYRDLALAFSLKRTLSPAPRPPPGTGPCPPYMALPSLCGVPWPCPSPQAWFKFEYWLIAMPIGTEISTDIWKI